MSFHLKPVRNERYKLVESNKKERTCRKTHQGPKQCDCHLCPILREDVVSSTVLCDDELALLMWQGGTTQTLFGRIVNHVK